ncbi:hypothetical protein [Leptolyngbya sp. 7M]|uniref:hypothetical protein n=1 Tax=Leptolyngbya sp. 7M TaxID=2812896 RepID=UPI001B8BD405|nr:hypothetical protein [Leptolyngbya sp. 7M]QYO67228.1 hypothetical protein JVX88_10735 [Leptolyngbya sp. 7M]
MPVDDTLSNPIDQNVQQSGKFGVNIGQGQEIHIGDIYQQIDPETVKQIVREELRLPQKEYGNSVGRGLAALAELMHHSEARSAVITFGADFRAACEQIDVIANYKELHDLLHTLEFQCYSGILQEAKRFSDPEDDTALEILMEHELTLQGILREVKNVAGRETIAISELLWLKHLEHAQGELHAAIETLDTRRLQRTIWLLSRILAIQPSRINPNLNAAAKALRLPALVNAMQAIWKSLVEANLNQEKIQQFQIGVVVLAELNQRLTALIYGHDCWQEFDLELRRIETNLDKDLIELEMSWPDLKERTESLFDPTADQWTLAFQQDSQNLDAALQAKNPAKIKRYFRMYRRRASERFYQVDVTLRRLCEELREVGEPLASVLRMIE